MGLIQLELHNIHVQAKSLNDAWQQISDQSGIRTILYTTYEQKSYQEIKFTFDSDKCTAGELLTALENGYPGCVHTQDKKSGVIWLHPRTVPYETILTNKVLIEKNVEAIPMQTGILGKFGSLKIYNAGSGGTITLNTFDHPVDLLAGNYSIRDILNTCCLANPNRTFFVSLGYHQICFVRPLTVILFYGSGHDVTPALLSFWKSNVDSTAKALPTEKQLIDTLADNDPRVRLAARNYIEFDLFEMFSKLGNLLSKSDTLEKSMWVAIANLNVVAYTDPEGPILHLPETDKMEKALKEEDWSGNTGLKALVAMEVARVTRDTTFLEQVAKQPLSVTAIANVKPDIIRTLRVSPYSRGKLLALNPQWAGFSKAEIEALSQTNIFSLP